MIEIGCCGFCLKGYSAERALQSAAGVGFRHVSLGMNGPAAQVNPHEAAAEPEAVGRRLRDAADAVGVQLLELFMCPLHVRGSGAVDPTTDDDEPRRRMLEAFAGVCRMAATAGFSHVMGVPGHRPEGGDAGRVWERAVPTLREMVQLAADAGIGFTVEAYRGSIADEPADLRRLLVEVPELMLTLDYAHFIGAGHDPAAMFDVHHRVRHLHVKPAKPGAFKCRLEDNAIDFAAVLADLQRRGFAGCCAAELFGPAAEARTLHEHAMADILRMSLELETILQQPAEARASGVTR